jgi:hypothetical protein
MTLLFLHGRWIEGEVVGISGVAISLYIVVTGAASIYSSRRPVTNREIQRQRRQARQSLFQLAQGNLPSNYTHRGRIITLVTGSIVTIIGTLTLLTLLVGIPGLGWVCMFLCIVALFVEMTLILDVFYIKAKAARTLPAQSAQELYLLLAYGELTAGEECLKEE